MGSPYFPLEITSFVGSLFYLENTATNSKKKPLICSQGANANIRVSFYDEWRNGSTTGQE